jgi:hypothetical protein
MKITLDRRTCSCWQPACETHFGWHFLREEVTPIDCTLEILDDGKEARTFVIKDRVRLTIPGSWPGRHSKLKWANKNG